VLGWTTESRRAGDDFALTHDWNEEFGVHITSDWDLFLNPLLPYRNLLAGNKVLETEFEKHYAQYVWFILGVDIPQPGDLVFESGRWIIDCGHGDYASEIHPPSVLALLRNYLGGTTADIWVNGWFDGTPTDVNIVPPPRPSPDQFLDLSKPRDTDAAIGLSVSFSSDADASTYIRARFQAPHRDIPVVPWSGQAKFLGGREYGGRWKVSWGVDHNVKVVPLLQLGTGAF
jgi:hypothetical protein